MTRGKNDLGRKPIVQLKISNLANGAHRYSFECVASEFEDESLDATRFSAPIHVAIALTKTSGEIVVNLSAQTVASLECDRCLAPIAKTIKGEHRIVFLRGGALPNDDEQADEARLISKNDVSIDLTDDVRQTLLLAVPMKNVCDGGCAETDAPIEIQFRQTPSQDATSEWQRKLAEIGKKLKT